jgi:hypothetical protein
MSSPLDYYAPRPPPPPQQRPREPRLSKLAVASIVLSLGQACSCPVIYRLGYAAKLPPIFIATALPLLSFIVSCIALFRILRRMEVLRGEGLAITGIIASFILCLLTAFIASGK